MCLGDMCLGNVLGKALASLHRGGVAEPELLLGGKWGGAPLWLVCKMAIFGSVYQQDKGREINKDANAICTNEATAGLGEVHPKAVERDN
jgi:hypothetical protein